MSSEKSGQGSPVAGSVGSASGKGVKGVKRERKHQVSSLDDFGQYANRQIQQARSALQKAQTALFAGKQMPKELVDACVEINKHVGQMLFG